ncbi:hypothetical protein, partial [Actinoplanes campanulatus]|uniref:hypothetical protein n=1 Tax=Actinoplanes campanulatus TaxID=113559 RepID=UPI00195477EE
KVWGLTPEQVRQLRDAYPHEDSTWLDSLDLAVLDVPGGHVVAVANGRDGFAVRDVGGTWRRIGFPTMPNDPAPLEMVEAREWQDEKADDRARLFAIVLAIFLGGLVITAVSAWRARRTGGHRHLLSSLLPPQIAFGGPVVFSAALAASGDDLALGFTISAMLLIVVLVVICGVLALVFARVPVERAVLLVALVVGAFTLVLICWHATGYVGGTAVAALVVIGTAAAVTPAAAKVV